MGTNARWVRLHRYCATKPARCALWVARTVLRPPPACTTMARFNWMSAPREVFVQVGSSCCALLGDMHRCLARAHAKRVKQGQSPQTSRMTTRTLTLRRTTPCSMTRRRAASSAASATSHWQHILTTKGRLRAFRAQRVTTVPQQRLSRFIARSHGKSARGTVANQHLLRSGIIARMAQARCHASLGTRVLTARDQSVRLAASPRNLSVLRASVALSALSA